MTCIAGIVYNDLITIGGDYLCTSMVSGSRFVGDSKAIATDKYAIGVSGSSRTEYFIRKFRDKHKNFDFKDIRYIDVLTDFLVDSTYDTVVQVENESDFINYPFELMVASPYGLWVIEQDLSTYTIKDIAVIGSGGFVGIGALEVLKDLGLPSDEVYQRLMKIVSKHNVTVGPDYWVHSFKRR